MKRRVYKVAAFGVVFLSLLGDLRADQVDLNEYGVLKGKVEGIGGGELLLKHTASAEHLRLDWEKVGDVKFEGQGISAKKVTQAAFLTNGDTYPFDSLELDGAKVSMKVLGVGNVNMARENLRGFRVQKALGTTHLDGIKSFDGWTRTSGSQDWKIEGKGNLKIARNGVMGKTFPLKGEGEFSVKIKRSDTPGRSMNLRFCLGGENASLGSDADRYIVTVLKREIIIQRERSRNRQNQEELIQRGNAVDFSNSRYSELIKIPINETSLEHQLAVKFNAEAKKILVSINGKDWKEVIDKSPTTIKGGAFIINNNGENVELQNLKLRSGESLSGLNIEHAKDSKTDIVQTTDKDSILGKVHKISTKDKVVLVKTEFQDELVKIPFELVSAVFLNQEAPAVATAKETFVGFGEIGKMAGEPLSLKDGKLSLKSPVVGNVQIDAGELIRLVRSKGVETKPKVAQPEEQKVKLTPSHAIHKAPAGKEEQQKMEKK